MFSKQDTLHVVLLDDTMSMNDQWKEGGTRKTSFLVAKNDMILDNIVKNVGQSTTNERLMILPLSKLAMDPTYQPKIYQRLNDKKTVSDIKEELDNLPPGKLHVSMMVGVKRAQQLLAENAPNRVTFHIISDFRQKDWGVPHAEELYKSLVSMAQLHKDMKIHLYDAAEKPRGRAPAASRSRTTTSASSISAPARAWPARACRSTSP